MNANNDNSVEFRQKHLKVKSGILLAVFLCITSISMGQIKYHGISLGIPFSSFKQQLLAKGYKYNADLSAEHQNDYSFHGTFAGEKVYIWVFVTPKSKLVYAVQVRFPEYDYSIYGRNVSDDVQTWKYNSIKNSLLKKYPTITPKEWKLQSITKATDWVTNNWEISLSTGFVDSEWQYLCLIYEDKLTKAKVEQEQSEDY